MGMKLLSFAFKNLLRRKTRTFLTTLGVAGAIAAVFFLIALQQGIQEEVKDLQWRLPDITLTVRGALPEDLAVREDLVAQLPSRIEGVDWSCPLIFQIFIKHNYGGMLFAMHENEAKRSAFKGLSVIGRWPGENESAVLIGWQIMRMGKLLPGDSIDYYGNYMQVVGVIEQTNTFVDFFMYLPIESAKKALGHPREPRCSYGAVWVKKGYDTKSVIQTMRTNLPKYESTEILPIAKAFEQFGAFGTMIAFAAGGIAFLIGSLILANTITLSTLERTREFSAMRALGCPKSFIFKDILVEAVLLTVVGGAIGCGLGLVVSSLFGTLSFTVSEISLRLAVIRITPLVPLVAMGVALVTGMATSLYPYRRIAGIPIDQGLAYL